MIFAGIMMARLEVFLWRVAVLAAVLATWEWSASISSRARFLAASPKQVAESLVSMVADGVLLEAFLVTGQEALSGLILGTLIGSTLGLLFWMSEKAALVSRPFILVLSTLPVFAIAPLLIVWFGIGIKMKIALATLATVFVSFNQGQRGAQAVTHDLLELATGLAASKFQTFVKIVVPGAFDWVLSSLRLNVGFALLGAFIGEFIAADRGLGYEILKASGLYDIPRALAGALGISVLALVFDRSANYIESRRHTIIQLISVPPVIWSRMRRQSI